MCNLGQMYSRQQTGHSRQRVRPAHALRLLAHGILLFLLSGQMPVEAQQFAFAQPLTARWQYATEDTINLTPATYAEQVYLPLAGGELVALRALNGQLNWKADVGGMVSSAPVADLRGVYVATETLAPEGTEPFYRATGTLRALSRKSGVTLWMRTLPRPISGALAADADTIFGGTTDGRVLAVNKETGEIRWQLQYTAPFASQPVLYNGRLYLGSEDGALLVVDQQAGRTLWRYQTRGPLRGPVALANQLVMFGSTDGYVYALDAQTGHARWRMRTGAGVQSVAATEGGLLVASLDNFVYLLSYRSGERIWKRQLAGRIAAQPLTGADGALLAPLGGDACVVLALHDGKTLNTLEVGTDGNTSASPIIAQDVLLITTRHGLIAFARPAATARH
jgi:eukaryotic-like serine/threonine-protein kinase